MFTDPRNCPVVVLAIGEHDLDLIACLQLRDVAPQVPLNLTRPRCLQIHDPTHARIDFGNVECARGFQGNLMACVAECRKQGKATLLRKRLTAGHANAVHTECSNAGNNLIDLMPLAAVEGIFGIAPAATQRASSQAHEHGRPADAVGLALQGTKDLGQTKTPACGRRWCFVLKRTNCIHQRKSGMALSVGFPAAARAGGPARVARPWCRDTWKSPCSTWLPRRPIV